MDKKKIATILDSGVLEKNNIKNILKFANELNIEFEIKNKILFRLINKSNETF